MIHLSIAIYCLLVVNGLSATIIMPNQFPPSATWTAHLRTTNNSELCPLCSFDGRHSINTKKNLIQ